MVIIQSTAIKHGVLLRLVLSGRRSCVSVPQADLSRDASHDVIVSARSAQEIQLCTSEYLLSEFKSGFKR